MIRSLLVFWLSFFGQLPTQPQEPSPSAGKALDKSAYYAFVDRDYIFTIEVVEPGIPLLNFISMAEGETKLVAKNIRIELQNRKAATKLLSIETGDANQPMRVGWLNIRPRSSFGLRLVGDFGDAKEISGAIIRLGEEDLTLAPLTSFDFEFLAMRINRINLGSPDFSEDWTTLRFQKLGSRAPARKSSRDF
jgi:hypothetical protein